jgi:uncharacterized tellurite resistance protein B-like protein
MLKAIRDFLDQAFGSADEGGDRHSIEVATAALLVEIVRMDGEVTQVERDAVLRAVRDKFHLSASDAQALVDLGEAQARQANDYYQFTSIINKRFTQAQKIRVVELLWEVAYADTVANPFEEHLIRKLSDLLYVDHPDYIHAKRKARDRALGTPPDA